MKKIWFKSGLKRMAKTLLLKENEKMKAPYTLIDSHSSSEGEYIGPVYMEASYLAGVLKTANIEDSCTMLMQFQF